MSDARPRGSFGRTLAVVEAIAGQLYLVVAALIVAGLAAARKTRG